VKLAFFGSGQMGSAVMQYARAAGHEIGTVLDIAQAKLSVREVADAIDGHDAAIDFSVADAVLDHAGACARAKVPLVEGTTGWHGQLADVRKTIEKAKSAMVYGANFSIGVNVLYRLVDRAGELFGGLADYGAFIEEAHHARKRDAPSGTALELRRILAGRLGEEVSITSTRAGHNPGVHRVGFDSAADELVLMHCARSREGFAAGAIAAAAWLAAGKHPGVHAFSDVLEQILAAKKERKS
jgi:4-hydroxy-tetrahydrodipicolinate reductase